MYTVYYSVIMLLSTLSTGIVVPTQVDGGAA